jgi:hypothetical protein
MYVQLLHDISILGASGQARLEINGIRPPSAFRIENNTLRFGERGQLPPEVGFIEDPI